MNPDVIIAIGVGTWLVVALLIAGIMDGFGVEKRTQGIAFFWPILVLLSPLILPYLIPSWIGHWLRKRKETEHDTD